jgi:hypothetical protein
MRKDRIVYLHEFVVGVVLEHERVSNSESPGQTLVDVLGCVAGQ